MWKEFKEFALRGSMIDMAVGIVVGAAFGAVVASLVADIINPVLGVVTGNADLADLFVVLQSGEPSGPYTTLEEAQAAGAVTLSYGVFLTRTVSFLIVSCVLFFLVRGMNRMRRAREAGTEPAAGGAAPAEQPREEVVLLKAILESLKDK